MKDDHDRIITDIEELANHVVSFYFGLFTLEHIQFNYKDFLADVPRYLCLMKIVLS